MPLKRQETLNLQAKYLSTAVHFKKKWKLKISKLIIKSTNI